MNAKERMNITNGVGTVIAGALVIFGFIRQKQMHYGIPAGPGLFMGEMFALSTLGGLGFAIGKGLACLFAPRATIMCPKCGSDKAVAASRALWTKPPHMNKCPSCNYQWTETKQTEAK